MALDRVWIRTLGDGLIRADQVIGISTHRTPALSGKPGRWLLTAALGMPAGSGSSEGWDLTNLHRTLAQADAEPKHAPEALAQVLARFTTSSTAGILIPVVCDSARGEVRFDFTPFDGGNGNGNGNGVPLTTVITRDSVGV